MKKLTTIEEIKKAVDAGETVYCGNEGSEVYKDRTGDYNIECKGNGYIISLHGLPGTQYENRLNGAEFFTA